MTQAAMERDEARKYLESLVDKVLRVHTSDSRVFVGLFKCTDNVGDMPRVRLWDLRMIKLWILCYI